jgi:hypothetical protein
MTEKDTRSIYEAAPLPLGPFIRVIRIRSSEVLDNSDPVACDFYLLNLDDKTLCNFNRYHFPGRVKYTYTALSYTWGEATPLHRIYLDGKPQEVRQNLFGFLQNARKNGLTDFLWIDALCIDQFQVQERNHQVRMMGRVYSRALKVIVWLGAVSVQVESVMEELKENSSGKDSAGMSELCHLTYWSRAWIVQEYVLAKEIMIWCETSQIEGMDFDDISMMGQDWSDGQYPAHKVITARSRWREGAIRRQPFALADEVAQRKAMARDNLKFTHILNLLGAYELQCADPRDRIYSLLSLLSPIEQARLGVTPDYSKSTSDLFVGIVRSIRVPYYSNVIMELTDAVDILAKMLKLDDRDEVVTEARKEIEEIEVESQSLTHNSLWSQMGLLGLMKGGRKVA